MSDKTPGQTTTLTAEDYQIYKPAKTFQPFEQI